MPKTNFFPSFPAFLRRSDRSFLFLALVFSFSLGTAIALVSFGKYVRDEAERPIIFDNPIELEIRRLVAGYPIERMIPYIVAHDVSVATLLVAIAKKESNWGEFAPEKNGKTCYNYWGYRGPENTTDSGYSCFASPGEAVRTVAARLCELLDRGLDTPEELVVWKRGFLETPLDDSEEKWVADVAYLMKKISNEQ